MFSSITFYYYLVIITAPNSVKYDMFLLLWKPLLEVAMSIVLMVINMTITYL